MNFLPKMWINSWRRWSAVLWVATTGVASAQLVSINALTNNASNVGVSFGTVVTAPSATSPANYLVYDKVGFYTVTNVVLQPGGRAVALALASNFSEFFYVTVSNVTDISTNVITGTASGYLSRLGNGPVGTFGDPSPDATVFTARPDAFEVTASGSDIGGTDDHFHFLYQPVVGDFDLAARVSRLDATDPQSKAGLIARESLDADSITIQTYRTPTNGNNEVEVAMRTVTAGITTDTNFQIGPRAAALGNEWLRLTRVGNVFTAYHGSNGLSWVMSGSTTQAFATDLFVGLATCARTNGGMTTAVFEQFGCDAVRPGDGDQPTMTVSVVGTNVVLSWPRPPRDFAIQISTNLTYWPYYLAPIYVTGPSNNVWQMLIPITSPTNQVYARATRVERVIPDPPLALQTGIIWALGNCSINASAANSLCGHPVMHAVALNRLTVAAGHKVTFTTAESGSGLDTVLSVTSLSTLMTQCDDNSAGNLKSKVVFTTGSKDENFTFVAAVKPTTPTTPTSQIIVKAIIE